MKRYTTELVSRIDTDRKIHDKYKVYLLIPENSDFKGEYHHIKILKIGKKRSGPIGRILFQQFTLPLFVKRNKAVGLDTSCALPIWGFRYIGVPDCIWEEYPENFRTFKEKLGRAYHIFRVKRIARNHKIQLFTLSEFSKKEICRFYGHIEDRIKLVQCGWEHMNLISENTEVFNKFPELKNGEYYFSLGSIYKHKNFEWIINAARNNPDMYFAVSGAYEYSTFFSSLNVDGLNNLVFTGYLTDEEVKTLIMHCKALIQPSFYEGFGLPPLEALSLGKRAIVSNSCCFPEIYKKSVIYIDPSSKIVDMNKLDKQTETPIDVLKKYSWKNAEKQLRELLLEGVS